MGPIAFTRQPIHKWVLLALPLLAACSDDERSCSEECSNTVVLTFEPPLQGAMFRFRIGDSFLTCSQMPCSSEAIEVTSVDDQVSGLTWSEPVVGAFDVRVQVDGMTAIDTKRAYVPTGSFELCGKRCNDPVRFTVP